MGVSVEIDSDAARLRPAASEVTRLLADIGKAHRLAGWTPRFGGRDGFRRGLEVTIGWFSDPANLARFSGEHQL
jgi:hypothetical protein